MPLAITEDHRALAVVAAAVVAGSTSEIVRKLIAEGILGLPRDPVPK